MNIAEQTWTELGHEIQSVGERVIVRTDAVPEKIGSIFLPTKLTTFYGALKGTSKTVYATVLGVGPDCYEGLKPGDKVQFSRFNFGYYKKMADNTYTGWINESEIELLIEDPH